MSITAYRPITLGAIVTCQPTDTAVTPAPTAVTTAVPSCSTTCG